MTSTSGTTALRDTSEKIILLDISCYKLIHRNIEDGCERYNRMAFHLLQSETGKELDKLQRHYLELMVQNAGICAKGMKLQSYLMYGPSFLSGIQGSLPNAFKSKSNFVLEDLKDYQVVVERLKKVR